MNQENQIKIKIQKFGAFLSGMVMPNIGAFIAWGLLTALFIPTGWFPNERLGSMVGPTLNYLMPVLIGYTGGWAVYGRRGGVIGAISTMGVVIGADITMLIGGMIMGPLGAWIMKQVDKLYEGKVKPGMEMLVDNFSMGIVGLIMMIFGFVAIEPIISVILSVMTVGVNFLINAKLLPLTALFVQPGQVLFLNNAINHGIMTPIAIEQAAKFGKSVIFLVEANCGCWFGITLAFMFFGKGMAKKSAPAAALIMFFGGIGEVVFPYVLSKPKTLLGAILGNMASLFILTTFNGGTVAAVAMLVASFFLMRDKTEDYETEAALNTEGVGEPADTLETMTPSGNIENIIFACDAGMGSSVMGVSVMKNMLKKAMIYKNVEHVSVAEIPEKADLIVTTKSLEGRVRDVIKKYNKDIPVFAVDNLMNNAEYEKIIEYLKTLS
ncbi:EIICBA-Mtl [Sebaldella termitidis]|uniref:protein-N(pi)-phosphohistidine--D-mannitol phosphotransferase n=1 Tax=Sebaldella termitidis (strain ATCC 33386 / NCTC 11300) TaxID=526218 RepID=D1AP57_SEBTE|nr:PTS mannitol transporter subunit IICB [Sebaldella termitidis]ACZ07531.1 phosphotransferase system lactose/cellobiose- specific IIB subunit [Sebaldella termitidis ATCC 33386]SUI22827.1 EIICBA-Mtl [Sebaldella termitidis]